MIVKNTLKTFGSNFLIVWKQLLFNLIFGAIITLLVMLLAMPIVDVLKTSGWINSLTDFFETIYTSPKNISIGFRDLATQLFLVLKANAKLVWGSYFFIVFVLFFVLNFGLQISNYVCADLVFGKMKSLVTYSYTNRFFATIKASSRYAVVRMIYMIPFWGLYILVGYIYGVLANTLLRAGLMLPLLFVGVILISALKNALFVGFLPKAVEYPDKKMFRNASTGLSLFKNANFGKIFISSLIIILLQFAIIVGVAVLTLGVGLIILIPAIPVLYAIFSMVATSTVEKTKYYVNENLIVTPL